MAAVDASGFCLVAMFLLRRRWRCGSKRFADFRPRITQIGARMIFRKVIKTETATSRYSPRRNFRIFDTLECGHEVSVKGSAGFAAKRRCKNCEQGCACPADAA